MRQSIGFLLLASCLYPMLAQQPSEPKPQGKVVRITQIKPGLIPDKSFDAWVGKPVADVRVRDLQGKDWSISSLKGRVVYLNFWITGCVPCVMEIPELNKIHSDFAANPDLVMLSLAFDNEVKLRHFLLEHPIDFSVSCIQFEILKKLAMPGSNIGFPTHMIIDRSGKLIVASSGGGDQISKDLKFSLVEALEAKRGQ